MKDGYFEINGQAKTDSDFVKIYADIVSTLKGQKIKTYKITWSGSDADGRPVEGGTGNICASVTSIEKTFTTECSSFYKGSYSITATINDGTKKSACGEWKGKAKPVVNNVQFTLTGAKESDNDWTISNATKIVSMQSIATMPGEIYCKAEVTDSNGRTGYNTGCIPIDGDIKNKSYGFYFFNNDLSDYLNKKNIRRAILKLFNLYDYYKFQTSPAGLIITIYGHPFKTTEDCSEDVIDRLTKIKEYTITEEDVDGATINISLSASEIDTLKNLKGIAFDIKTEEDDVIAVYDVKCAFQITRAYTDEVDNNVSDGESEDEDIDISDLWIEGEGNHKGKVCFKNGRWHITCVGIGGLGTFFLYAYVKTKRRFSHIDYWDCNNKKDKHRCHAHSSHTPPILCIGQVLSYKKGQTIIFHAQAFNDDGSFSIIRPITIVFD